MSAAMAGIGAYRDMEAVKRLVLAMRLHRASHHSLDLWWTGATVLTGSA
ncbi:hypothetical protein [Micromonospora sp. NPDC002717]